MTWRPPYVLAACLLLGVEILIALFVRDRLVRPFVGDALAVALVYLALRAVLPLRTAPATATAFIVAIAMEFGQLFGLLDILGLRNNALARVGLGTGFDPMDFAAYAAGALIVLIVEAQRRVGVHQSKAPPKV